MRTLVIASNNKGKIKEIKSIISEIHLLSLSDIGFKDEIEEPYNTFNENAYVKAKTVKDFCSKNVFSDDSGICVPSLNNEPGVQSAYYGGIPRSDEQNNERLLKELEGKEDRSAFYKAVICLIWNDETYYFEGECYGAIANAPEGDGGFGYDPLFIPNGYNNTFGTLPVEIKNKLSHRGIAVSKMVEFLKEEIGR